MAEQVFVLPDVGEGLTEAEILSWHVKVGDEVVVNQTIVEIETAKAAVELPCPYAGVVGALHVAEGDVVEVGRPILTIVVAGAEPAGEQTGAPPTATADPAASAAGAQPGGDAGAGGPAAQAPREAVLVGYGVRDTSGATRRPRVSALTPQGTVTPEAGPPGEAVKPVRHGGLEVGRHAEELLSRQSPVLAKPPVRKLARDLGVDLGVVAPTGVGGVITRADVQRASAAVPQTSAAVPVSRPRVPAPEREERIPVRGVLRSMADAMVRSAFTAPHVTEWVQADVTRSMSLVDRLKASPQMQGVRVSPLLLAAAALLHAVRRHPRINATWDDTGNEIVVKHYVNLGIAAATPRGLVVPNVKDADRLSLPELAAELADLVQTARDGRTTPAALTGGTITITNVGVFGVDGGTPILNPGEAAILALGQVAPRPWVHRGKVRARQVMELSLSFDHRLVDGALGSQVLADVAAFLNDPELALALG
jgi:pyruvate dehydrogenase E2 component (dihydrolipoamide acetyltransferase)